MLISSTAVRNGTEENNSVAHVMDERPKDLGAGSSACENRERRFTMRAASPCSGWAARCRERPA